MHAYDRGVGRCITGGTFYDPPREQFPARYRGKYFFCDYMDGWIRVLDPARPGLGTPPLFARGLRGPVDLRVADARQLPFEGASFDAAYSSFTLELFPEDDLPHVLAEVRRKASVSLPPTASGIGLAAPDSSTRPNAAATSEAGRRRLP